MANLPMKDVFENLFKLDPVLSGLSMTPIAEEGNPDFLKRDKKLMKKHSLGSIFTGKQEQKEFCLQGQNELPRRASTSSCVKNKSPLSRFWQIRRRSCTQFELSSADAFSTLCGNGSSSEEIQFGSNVCDFSDGPCEQHGFHFAEEVSRIFNLGFC